MSTYLFSKIVLIFFSISTVLLFVLSRENLLYRLAGSVEAGVAVYITNAVLLCVSVIYYAVQRGRDHNPARERREFLDAALGSGSKKFKK